MSWNLLGLPTTAPVAAAASMMITKPGVYVVTAANITITLGPNIAGVVAIVDGSGAENPNVTIVGVINGAANFTLDANAKSVVLTPGLVANTWNILA